MPDFRRGMKAMAESQDSQKRQGNNPFPAFCPSIQWRDDREEKYIALLNRPEDIPTVKVHTFIPTGTWPSGKPKFDEFIDRTDPGIGEDTDDLTDRLGRKSQERGVAVAVELEPTYSTVNGRKRPTGFQVKTETFTRKTEDGGTEEVEAPVIGILMQSPRNFFGWVGSFHESTAPVEETPLQIIRRGKDQHTAYDFTPFLDQPVDYTNLFENIGNVSYLRGDLDGIDLTGEALDAALSIGNIFLDKRLNELSDGERYERLVSPITEIEDRFGNNSAPAKPAPQQRPSQRTAQAAPAEESPAPSKGGSKFEELRKMHETAA